MPNNENLILEQDNLNFFNPVNEESGEIKKVAYQPAKNESNPRDLKTLINDYHFALMENQELKTVLEEDYCIPERTIIKLKIGYDSGHHSLIVPAFNEQNNIVSYAFFNVDITNYSITIEFENPQIDQNTRHNINFFGLQTLKRNSKRLIVVENILDYILLQQETDYSILASVDLKATENRSQELIGYLEDYYFKDLNFILAQWENNPEFKNDSNLYYSVRLQYIQDTLKVLYTYKPKTDIYITELGHYSYKNHCVFNSILESLKHSQYLLNQIANSQDDPLAYFVRVYTEYGEYNRNFENAKKILYSTRSWYKPEKLIEVINQIEIIEEYRVLKRDGKFFRAKDLEKLRKLSEVKPTKEQILKDQILKIYDFIYNPEIGIRQYDPKRGIWKKIYIKDLHKLIQNETPNEQSRTTIKYTGDLILSEVSDPDITFDNNPVLVMKNCTLDLNTGMPRPHSPKDMATKYLDINYSETADCPKFKQLLNEIFNGDQISIDLIQEVLGYGLIFHNGYQHIFLFHGEGGCGKSTLGRIIEGTFEGDKVSHLKHRDFKAGRAFRLQMLQNAWFNIANDETKSGMDFSILPDDFFNMVDGDKIVIEHKGIDPVDIKPHAVPIITSNYEFIIDPDNERANTRRIIQIDFPNFFTEDPDPNNPYHKKAIPNIENEILEERAGIINFALKGRARILSRVKRGLRPFTYSPASERAKERMRAGNNEFYEFISLYEDKILKPVLENKTHQMSYDNVKKLYFEYCKEIQQKPKLGRSFTRPFGIALRKSYPEFYTKSSGNKTRIYLKDEFKSKISSYADYLKYRNSLD